MFTGFLPSGKRGNLPTVGQSWFDKLNIVIPSLINREPIGSRDGPNPDALAGRIMASLGADGFRSTLALVEASVNNAKKHLFKFENLIDIKKIEARAEAAMKLDTQEAADALLTSIRTVSRLLAAARTFPKKTSRPPSEHIATTTDKCFSLYRDTRFSSILLCHRSQKDWPKQTCRCASSSTLPSRKPASKSL